MGRAQCDCRVQRRGDHFLADQPQPSTFAGLRPRCSPSPSPSCPPAPALISTSLLRTAAPTADDPLGARDGRRQVSGSPKGLAASCVTPDGPGFAVTPSPGKGDVLAPLETWAAQQGRPVGTRHAFVPGRRGYNVIDAVPGARHCRGPRPKPEAQSTCCLWFHRESELFHGVADPSAGRAAPQAGPRW